MGSVMREAEDGGERVCEQWLERLGMAAREAGDGGKRGVEQRS